MIKHHLPVPQSAISLVQTKILYRVKSTFPFIYIGTCYVVTNTTHPYGWISPRGQYCAFLLSACATSPTSLWGFVQNSQQLCRICEKKIYRIINITYLLIYTFIYVYNIIIHIVFGYRQASVF